MKKSFKLKQALSKIKLQLVFVTIYLLTDNSVHSACNVCQENDVACVNLTSYYKCFGSTKPSTQQLFTCPYGLECTNLPNICFQSSTLAATCDNTSSCGKCNANQIFACTTRTTFRFCFGSVIPSDVEGFCPQGKVCDASSDKFCVNELTPTSIVCDLELQAISSSSRKFIVQANNFNN